MKLYATTTSERASKGQGGNKQLTVEFKVETDKGREIVGQVEMRVERETIHLISNVPQYKVYIKGKSQKGERNFAIEHINDADMPQV